MVVYEVYARDARVRRHCRALVAAGHEVTVLAVVDERSPAAAAADGVELVAVARSKYRGDRRSAYLVAYASFTLRVFGAVLRRVVDRPSPSVIYINNPPDFLVFAAWPARMRSIPIVLDVHDMTTELYTAKFGADRGIGLAVVRAVERASYRFTDAVITVADAYGRRIAEIVGPGTPIATVWNVPDGDWAAIGEERARRNGSSGPLRLGHHGTIVERFGIDVGVKAVALMRRRGLDVTLDILGDGDFADELERLIGAYGLSDVVRFDRRTFDHADLIAFTDGIDVGIAPYRPSEFTSHSLPTKLLEYMALGVPAVVTETEMIRDYLGDGVHTIRGGSAEELVSAIEELIDVERRAEYRRAGLELARRHGWPQQRERLLSFIDDVSRRRRRSSASRP
jgi:glycosyltransferase involved in cell wall biosynthesis